MEHDFIPGEIYSITTETEAKLDRTLPREKQCPYQVLIKTSTYSIQVLTETPEKDPNSKFQWLATDKPHIALYHGKRYLLCRLASIGYGHSEFCAPETGEVFSKAVVSKWLKATSKDYPEYLTLPFDTLKSVDRIVTKPAIAKTVAVETPVQQSIKQTVAAVKQVLNDEEACWQSLFQQEHTYC
jgi:hypothetical protein